MIALYGDRVVLRTLERKHCHRLWETYEPDAERPTEPLNPGRSAEGADEWFDDMQSRQGTDQLYLGVFDREGRLLGDIQLSSIDWRHRTANIGLGLSLARDRGQGFGTDAGRVLIRYAFEHLDLMRISVATIEYNEAAIGSLSKLGFVAEGRDRSAIYSTGRRWDRVRFGLLRSEWTDAG